MDLAFFPTSVTDFFYAALQKIKSERVANDHKKVKQTLYTNNYVAMMSLRITIVLNSCRRELTSCS